jgi:tRNA threonylcarbamoyladenosine biosynthesis protein TsaE
MDLTHPATLNESELADWGKRFGRSLHPPHVVALSGDLGAGKTTLVKAICEGYGVAGTVTSPTFALIHRYEGSRGAVIHIDLYRLNGPRECAQLGLEEMLGENALMLVEWPERAGDLIPESASRFALEYDPARPDVRTLRLE